MTDLADQPSRFDARPARQAPACRPQIVPRGVVRGLVREWERLRHRPDALRQAMRWRIVEGPLDDLDQILAAVGYDLVGDPTTDQRLRRLVEIAAGDDLACRVVVHRLLPGLHAILARRTRQGADDLSDLVTALWIAVRTFNPMRQPACLAAALLADANYAAFRAPTRRRSFAFEPLDAIEHVADPEPRRHPWEELVEVLAEARRVGLADADMTLLRQLTVAPRILDVAASLDVTPRTVRSRRDRVTERVRDLVSAA